MKNSGSLLERIGRELAGQVSATEQSWVRFVRSSPEAAEMAYEFSVRLDELEGSDPPPPEFCPDWDEERRQLTWTCAGDRRLGELKIELFRRWYTLDSGIIDPTGIPEDEQMDSGSYLFYLERLPDPLIEAIGA